MNTAIHIELDLLCFVMLYAIANQSAASVNQQMKRVLFRNLVYGVMIQLILDALWLLVEGRSFPGGIIANKVLNALFLTAGVFLGSIWYLYVLERLGYTITKKLQIAVTMPGCIYLVLNTVSMWTGWIFTVSPDNVYARGPMYWLHVVGAYGMLAIALVHLVVWLIRRKDHSTRTQIKELLSFYFLPLIGSVVSLFYTGMPGAWTCAAVSIVLLYLNDQDREIIRDGLTGLNNRKTLAPVFEDYSRLAGPQAPLYAFMMDLDNFKKINDTWGHPVGDQALADAGRILSSCMKGRKGILIRYGGDEFLIMGFLAGEEEAEAFRQEIYRKFADYQQEHSLAYRFAISVGYARYREGQKLAELVDAADDALYLEKKRNNAARGAAWPPAYNHV